MKDKELSRRRFLQLAGSSAVAIPALAASPSPVIAETGKKEAQWFRGNLHMHTLRSDGDAFPEEAAALYKRLGYHFVALTDHNSTHENPDIWIKLGQKNLTAETVSRYKKNFGFPLEKKMIDGSEAYRLKTFPEMEKLLCEEGRFLMISGNEVSSGAKNGEELHVGFVNTKEGCKTLSCQSARDKFYWSLGLRDTVLGRNNQETLYIVNHPLWRFYDIDPMMLVDRPDVRFFEVANVAAGPLFPATEEFWTHDKFWDIINAFRAQNGDPLIYGIGSDDTHGYSSFYHIPRQLGYVMVHAQRLSIPSLFRAMYKGDFYASSGVDLKDVAFDSSTRTLSVEVLPKAGWNYTIQFIGTRQGFDPAVQKEFVFKAQGNIPEWALKQNYVLPVRKMKVYSKDIGQLFKEVKGTRGAYTMQKDDLYVRAK
ncbi:MAG: hypothetical protein Q4G59_07080, partial [Planctomycetia bacterium]|nr:hypothetical protein [Planctomycetia bacterium]